MAPTEPSKYDDDFVAIAEATRWLDHINLRRHRGNPEVRAAVHAARAAVTGAYDALLAVELAEPPT